MTLITIIEQGNYCELRAFYVLILSFIGFSLVACQALIEKPPEPNPLKKHKDDSMNFEERTQLNEQKIQKMSDTITDIVEFPILAAAAAGTSAVKIIQNAVEASAHAGTALSDAMSKPIHASAQLGSAITENPPQQPSNYWRERISAEQQRASVAVPQR